MHPLVRRALTGLALIGSPLAVHAQSSNLGKLAGRVVDVATGEPLSSASVALVGTSIGAATNLDGDYWVLNIPAGMYTVRVSYVGYKPIEMDSVWVDAQREIIRDFQLTSNATDLDNVKFVGDPPFLIDMGEADYADEAHENIDCVSRTDAALVRRDGVQNQSFCSKDLVRFAGRAR